MSFFSQWNLKYGVFFPVLKMRFCDNPKNKVFFVHSFGILLTNQGDKG